MPKGKTAARASTPQDEVDELADDAPQLPTALEGESGPAKGRQRRTLSGAGNRAIAPTAELRSRPHKDKTSSSTGINDPRQRAARARTKSTEADENDEARAVASTSGAASLARFRYTGPSAGPHQRIDSTTLSDTMMSSDPATGDSLASRASRPPKRVHEDQAAEPRKARTPPNDTRKRTSNRKEEPVFVFPELDEDGNPIDEEELSDDPEAAVSSSGSSPARSETSDAPDVMQPAADKSSTTLRSPSKPSPARSVAANLPPSSIELPNALADRIYKASPTQAAASPPSTRRMPVENPLTRNEAFSPSAAKGDRIAPASKSQYQADTPIQETGKVKRPIQPTPSTVKLAVPAPKQLSAADLRAVAEVLEDLDSQTFSDVDVDKPAVSQKRTQEGLGAVNLPERLVEGAASVTAGTAATDLHHPASHADSVEQAFDKHAPAKLSRAPQAQATMSSDSGLGSKLAPPPLAARIELKVPRRVRTPPPRPASYRLVANSLDGAIAHLRNVFNETLREAGSQTHEITYLRNETNRLADELEGRNAAIGELLEEKHDLDVKLDQARRSEADFDAERTAWHVERAEYELRTDVLKEIRRGLLDEIRVLKESLNPHDASEDCGRDNAMLDGRRAEDDASVTPVDDTRLEKEVVATTSDAMEATETALASDVAP